MAKVKIVSSKELSGNNNPTMCWSAIRAFNDCHKCSYFKNLYRHYYDKAFKQMQCKPKFKRETLNLLKQKEKVRVTLEAKLIKINKKLEH